MSDKEIWEIMLDDAHDEIERIAEQRDTLRDELVVANEEIGGLKLSLSAVRWVACVPPGKPAENATEAGHDANSDVMSVHIERGYGAASSPFFRLTCVSYNLGKYQVCAANGPLPYVLGLAHKWCQQ